MKNLPNILSISRLIISGFLFFPGINPSFFTVLYLYCGLSDVADGYIARRWEAESAIGAKLDSLGDLVFYVLITVLFFTRTRFMEDAIILWLVVFIFAFKLLNVIITKIRFRQWGMLHTIGNKLSGLLVYFMLPLYILLPDTTLIIGLFVIAFVLAVTLEETAILLTADQYDPNRRSLFTGLRK